MKKRIFILLGAILLIALFVANTDFQSVEEYYQTHLEDINSGSQTVLFSITCGSLSGNRDALPAGLRSGEFVPADGVILAKTRYVLREEDTVFEILKRAAKHNRIQLEYSGGEKGDYGSAYIKGINHIYEFACGSLSGWMFKVNGEFSNSSCSAYKLRDGDDVEFIYTRDLGRDIGNPPENSQKENE